VDPYAALVIEAIGQVERGLSVGVVSAIVEMELLVKPLRDADILFVEKLGVFFRSVPNTQVRPVAKAGAEVRASASMRTPRAIIAATAWVERCDAIIGNDSQMAARKPSIPYLYLDGCTV
jgi:hypothetical protein